MLQNYTMQYWAYIGFDRRYTWVISPELFGKWAEKGRQRSWSQSSQSPERRVSHISSTYPKQLVCSLSFSCFFLRNTAAIALNYLLVFWRLQRTLLQSIKGRLREKCTTLGKSFLIAFHKWSSQVPQLTGASGPCGYPHYPTYVGYSAIYADNADIDADIRIRMAIPTGDAGFQNNFQIWSSVIGFRLVGFLCERNIVGTHGVLDPPSLATYDVHPIY